MATIENNISSGVHSYGRYCHAKPQLSYELYGFCDLYYQHCLYCSIGHQKEPSVFLIVIVTQVFLGLGSNINAMKNIKSCQQYLHRSFKKIRFSSAYQSPAYGFDGNDFINMAVEIHTAFELSDLKDWLKNIENKHGRKHNTPRYSDRSLDIDILFFGKKVLYNKNIQIPRTEITRRNYVLKPLAELAPEWQHPVYKKKLSDLWKAFQTKQSSQLVCLGKIS